MPVSIHTPFSWPSPRTRYPAARSRKTLSGAGRRRTPAGNQLHEVLRKPSIDLIPSEIALRDQGERPARPGRRPVAGHSRRTASVTGDTRGRSQFRLIGCAVVGAVWETTGRTATRRGVASKAGGYRVRLHLTRPPPAPASTRLRCSPASPASTPPAARPPRAVGITGKNPPAGGGGRRGARYTRG